MMQLSQEQMNLGAARNSDWISFGKWVNEHGRYIVDLRGDQWAQQWVKPQRRTPSADIMAANPQFDIRAQQDASEFIDGLCHWPQARRASTMTSARRLPTFAPAMSSKSSVSSATSQDLAYIIASAN